MSSLEHQSERAIWPLSRPLYLAARSLDRLDSGHEIFSQDSLGQPGSMEHYSVLAKSVIDVLQRISVEQNEICNFPIGYCANLV